MKEQFVQESIVIEVVRCRRKSMALKVARDGRVVVRAPYSVKKNEIVRFTEKYKDWIRDRLQNAQKRLSVCDGEELSVCGKTYKIASGKAEITDDFMILPEREREAELIKLLKICARMQMGDLTRRIAEAYGFSYRAIKISSARGRWGSCSKKGNISYTFRTALLPIELCEYLAVHELCHTLVFDHSPRFWKAVGLILPDYKMRKKRLKEYDFIMNSL